MAIHPWLLGGSCAFLHRHGQGARGASDHSPLHAGGCFQMPALCRYLAGNAVERLGVAARNAADVGCDIMRAYLEELQKLGALASPVTKIRGQVQNSCKPAYLISLINAACLTFWQRAWVGLKVQQAWYAGLQPVLGWVCKAAVREAAMQMRRRRLQRHRNRRVLCARVWPPPSGTCSPRCSSTSCRLNSKVFHVLLRLH